MVETIRGKGVYIAGDSDRKPDAARLEVAKKSLEPGLLELKVMGLSEDDVTEIIKELYGMLS